MEKDSARFLAYSDIREASSVGFKAVLLTTKYGWSQKAAARVLGINLNVVRKARKAHAEGRPIGHKGRPYKLSEEQEAELQGILHKMITEHRSPTKREVAGEVCVVFLLGWAIKRFSNDNIISGQSHSQEKGSF